MKADKKKITRLLKTAKGQIDGILKMIEDDRYCIDISNQILATNSILKKANLEILKAHLENCVKESLYSLSYSSFFTFFIKILNFILPFIYK